jgi:hypothetical protein
MDLFDENIVRRLEEEITSDSIGELCYKVVGDSDGIAVSKDGTGFARVELVARSSHDAYREVAALAEGRKGEKNLLSSVVSFQFEPKSYKICSLSWCVLKDAMGASAPNSRCGSDTGVKSESSAKESLESQIVYPSVVSLDPVLNSDNVAEQHGTYKNRLNDQKGQIEENPGMNI